jgi:hypothetical protein
MTIHPNTLRGGWNDQIAFGGGGVNQRQHETEMEWNGIYLSMIRQTDKTFHHP